MRVRFAPSPTGHLHVGNARTALFNWLLARHEHGTFILRIEDTDIERSTRESEHAIMDDLRWMGLTWDEGVEVGGDARPLSPVRAARHLRRPRAAAARSRPGVLLLLLRGEARSRAAGDARAGLPPKYAGTCRAIAPDDAARARGRRRRRPVIRLRVPAGARSPFDDIVRGPVTFHTDVIGDPVLVRSDGMPAYNFAVVIDDALMQVTHVVRGEDHISNTPRQVLLYEAFGWQPPAFAHLSLVMGPDHTPLSKRHGATSVAEFRAKGYLPEALVNYLALIGWSPGRGRGSAAARRARAPLRAVEGGAQRRRVRRGQAGVGQPPLSEERRIRRGSSTWRCRFCASARWWSASCRDAAPRVAAGHRAGAGGVARSAVAGAGSAAHDLFVRRRQALARDEIRARVRRPSGRARSSIALAEELRVAPRLTDRDIVPRGGGRA